MHFKKRSFPFLILIYAFLLIFGYSIFFYLKNFSLLQKAAIILICWIPFLLEFFVVSITLLFLYNQTKWRRIAAICILLLFLITGGIQFTSYLMYSDFLIADALANLEYIKLVFTKKSILLQVVFWLIAFVLIKSLQWSELKTWTTAQRLSTAKWFAVSFLVPLLLGIMIDLTWKPQKEARFPLYDEQRSPMVALSKTMYQFYLNKKRNEPFNANHIKSISPHIQPNEKYPLLKNQIYNIPFPFPKKSSAGKPNVIVFFVESFSSRNTSIYNAQLRDLTPNLQGFADTSLVVENYYNHTAATYRGIQGQLCSMFPFHGGENGWDDTSESKKLLFTKLKAIPDFLRQDGYHSTFIGSENEKIGGLDNMATSLLHFDEVICQKNILALIGDSVPTGENKTISDRQLIRSVNSYLEKRNKDQPLFLSIYNLGTHAWMDTPEGGVKYQDGKINIYNVVHNFDHLFGQFLDYFRQSPYANNTIIIVTADHCYPPVEEFVALAGEDYSPYFVDKIPLIIYDPGHRLPSRIDRGIRTSLDFAPTLLHLMEQKNQENHFLGVSIFDTSTVSPDYFAAIGAVPYLIKKDGIVAKARKGEDVLKMLRIQEYVDYVESLELENRVWR